MRSDRGESGSALIVVLVALLVLTPLALLVSTLATSYQRRSSDFRDSLRSRYAVRGGLEIALGRLRTLEPPIPLGDEQRFELAEADSLPVSVRMRRDSDAAVGIDGRVLRGRELSGVDVGSTGIDGERRVSRRYQPLQLYVVQAEIAGSPSSPGMRLVASVARTEDGEMLVLGTRYDTALFESR